MGAVNDERHSPYIAAIEFNTLEDALTHIAELAENERLSWWGIGDACEACLMQFGRTKEVKGALATQLGCGRRMVEIHAAVAATFAPEHRYPDRPCELYKELVKWHDPIGGLMAALEGNWSAADARRARLEADGQREGAVLFRRQEAVLYVHHMPEGVSDGVPTEVTHYAISWDEFASAAIAQDTLPVWVTVSERVSDE